MTRIIGLIFILVVLLFGLSFAALNAGPVQIHYFFGTRQAPLSLILVLAFVFGALFGTMFNLGVMLRLKRQISRLRKEVTFTEKEVKNLRTLPVKDRH